MLHEILLILDLYWGNILMLREILLILVFVKYVFLKYFWRLKTIVFMALILGQPWTTPHIDTNNHKNPTAPNPWLSSNKNTTHKLYKYCQTQNETPSLATSYINMKIQLKRKEQETMIINSSDTNNHFLPPLPMKFKVKLSPLN